MVRVRIRGRPAVACLSTRVCRKISAATLARVHGQVRPGVAGASWCEDFIYRAIAHHRENGTIESFNGKLRDELLEREAFDTLLEAKVLFRSVAAEHQHDPGHTVPSDTGLEHAIESSGWNGCGTQSDTLDAREAPLGSDLKAVVSAWSNLPEAIWAGILAMIGATKLGAA